ncbi:hypothetical protein Lfu02_00740 [Longispora fulva]|uniref:Adenylate cyclase class 2 n=1 Tax=Longispora fulva TaxID=619741 RepID=A0A8J7KJZ2_9ACTN|nr:class IV adenylate cyclase [Longispora fulva]MBG6136056.1 adenylate cyclase class 2 [Longispora fulva]GIG55702.1 hypothetical protein Lfu02_00740 [Longispora fulva]
MKPEYEARFYDVDPATIADTLAARGATCTMPRTLMRRVIFTNHDIAERGGWLRLREQGERIFLTYKQNTAVPSAIDSVLETELEVSDFHATRTLLEAMGCTARRYQENYREEWTLHGVTFDLDIWPDLRPFLEIEGTDEAAVRRGAEVLGLDFTTATFGSVDKVYLTVLDRDILTEDRLVFTSA